jgi:hypothetical protein
MVREDRNSSYENNALQQYFRNIEYLENNIDFPPEIGESVIDLYMYHKRIYCLVLVGLLLLNLVCSFMGIFRRDRILENIIEINNRKEVPKFFIVFLEIGLTIDIVAYISVFICGVMSLFTNKSRIFNMLSTLCVFEIFSSIMLCYIHQLFLIAFLLRTVFYVYTRFLISMLHTLLLMPRLTS